MKNKDNAFCRNGHPLTEETLYVSPSGNRKCRTCARTRERNRRGAQSRVYADTSARPPEELVAEAQRRSMAPRSLTAMVLGDPPEGYSQLDRRQSA